MIKLCKYLKNQVVYLNQLNFISLLLNEEYYMFVDSFY